MSVNNSLERIKTLAHSLEAEQLLLGSILLDERSFDYIAGTMLAKYFYRKEHQTIFEHIVQLRTNNKTIDVVMVSENLKTSDKLDNIGGSEYLYSLVEATPSSSNITSYAELIRERFVLRELITVSTAITNLAYSPQGRNAETVLDEAEQLVFNIKDTHSAKQQFLPFNTLVDAVLTRMMAASQRIDKTAVTGIATHYLDLDKYTSGLQRGELIIIAGRPGIGKTSFALNIAENVALIGKLPVAVFSLEMPGVQLVQRLLSSRARVSQHIIRHGDFKHDDLERIYSAVADLKDAQLYISESSGINVIDLRAHSRRLADKVGNLGLIVIDYVQIMSSLSGNYNTNRAQEIAEISRSLKSLAIELDVPIILLSQLNRDVESRMDKRPNISDLRESGALEQDADIVLLLYRDEYYLREESKEKGIAEVNIAKNRNGSTGLFKLAFLHQYTRFENLAISWETQ